MRNRLREFFFICDLFAAKNTANQPLTNRSLVFAGAILYDFSWVFVVTEADEF